MMNQESRDFLITTILGDTLWHNRNFSSERLVLLSEHLFWSEKLTSPELIQNLEQPPSMHPKYLDGIYY